MKCKHLWMWIAGSLTEYHWCEKCGTLRISEWYGKVRRTYRKPKILDNEK